MRVRHRGRGARAGKRERGVLPTLIAERASCYHRKWLSLTTETTSGLLSKTAEITRKEWWEIVGQKDGAVKAMVYLALPISPSSPLPRDTWALPVRWVPDHWNPCTLPSAWTAWPQFLGLLSPPLGLRSGGISSPPRAVLLCTRHSHLSVFSLIKLCWNLPDAHLTLPLDWRSSTGPWGSDLAFRQNHALFGLQHLGSHGVFQFLHSWPKIKNQEISPKNPDFWLSLTN